MDEPIPRLTAALEGRYRIEGEIGAGGSATVYLALDLRHERKVALKVLHPELTAVVAGKRFLAEIRTTASLQHPHILPLFDSGEAGGHLYYAMPYVEGETLRDRLEREGELPVEEALEIATDLAEGLDYAHRQGVVHRDIKPENVLFHGGRAVIADFGIALAVDAAGGSRITGTGQSVGTPYYMSPEQASAAASVDRRSDVYSLACVVHEMLTGEPVFTAKTARGVLAKHLNAEPIGVRTLRTSVPKGVEEAILQALAKAPADRFSAMGDFAEALASSASSTPSLRAVWTSTEAWLRGRPFAATAAALVLVGTALVVAPFVRGPAWTDRPSSIAVLPFRESGSTEEEAGLAVELADMISRELQAWNGLSVATGVELAGPRRDMGLSEPLLERSSDGAALARAADAEAMLAVTVRQRGDSVSLQANLFDSGTGRRVGDPVMAAGELDAERSERLMAPVLASVLGFGDAPSPARAIGAGTGNPEAAGAYLQGREALERNRLDAAEGYFERAIELDSTFASALSFLGQTHYWRGVEQGNVVSFGPEISRWGTAATRQLRGLSLPNEEHVRGFYAFQLGNFEEARRRYRAAIEIDAADTYALLMLGEIELLDRWSVRDSLGQLVPGSNLNRARRAFSDVVQREPTFELAYGRMFELHRRMQGALLGSCSGFEEVRGEWTPIWQLRVPGPGMYPLCPVALDSLQWVPFERLASLDQAVLRAGVDRLFDQAVGELTRWSNFAPDQPRPLELLSDAYVIQRRQSGTTAPERHQALAADALKYRTRALALQADTTPSDFAELANLQMAAGKLEAAMESAERSLSAYLSSGTTPSDRLMNVLLVGGRAAAALTVVDRLPDDGGLARYLPDPETGENVPVAAGGRSIQRLRALAAAGISGDAVTLEFERLDRAWAAEGYSDERRRLLRDGSWNQVAAALAFDSLTLREWRRSSTVDDPAWLAFVLSDTAPERAALELRRALASEARNPGPTRTFIMAVAAEHLGLGREAISLYSRLDSIPHLTTSFDVGWGLQVVSQLERARTYLALGDSLSAIEHLDRFMASRAWPDSLTAPLVSEAERMLAGLTGEPREAPGSAS